VRATGGGWTAVPPLRSHTHRDRRHVTGGTAMWRHLPRLIGRAGYVD
jgi:hypothetical protein